MSQNACCATCCFLIYFPVNCDADYSKHILLAIPHLLINCRPHCCRHPHKHSACTAAILWDLWSVYSVFPDQRFLLTCKNSGDVLYWKRNLILLCVLPNLLLSVPQPYCVFWCWVNIYITVCVCPHYIFLCVLDTACCIVLINVAGKYVPLV